MELWQTPADVEKLIRAIAKEDDSSLASAVVEFAKRNNLEHAQLLKLLNKSLQDDLEIEAIRLNVIRRPTSGLPFVG